MQQAATQDSVQTSIPQPQQQLAAAFVMAQAEIQNVVKNALNPHFKSGYATLDAVIDTVKPTFAKYGLAVMQAPGKLVELGAGGLAISVVTSLIHGAGAMINFETQLPLGQKATAQAAGGAITYARRYALAAVAGIAQVDDDGNEASDDGPPVIEGLEDAIDAAESMEELEQLQEAVQASGDKALVNRFVKQRAKLRKGKK